MKNFKEYSFGGGATGPYRPIADVGDFAGKVITVDFMQMQKRKLRNLTLTK